MIIKKKLNKQQLNEIKIMLKHTKRQLVPSQNTYKHRYKSKLKIYFSPKFEVQKIIP